LQDAGKLAAHRLPSDALICGGVGLPKILAAGGAIYGSDFNPLIALKALSYSGKCPRCRMRCGVDPARLPVLTPHLRRDDERGP
jgi:hypothetical protein